MNVDPVTTQPLVETVSLLILLPLLLVGGIAWFYAVRLTSPWDRRALVLVRVVIRGGLASLTLGAFLEILNYGIRWASEMPIAVIAGVAGMGVVAIHELYGRERQVTQPSIGRWILALRIGLFLLVLTMLNQPVLRWTRTYHVERRVAVLVDDSASMRSEERLWTPTETMDVAALLSRKEVPGRPDLQALREYLVALRMQVQAETVRLSAGEEERDRIAAFKRQVERSVSTLEGLIKSFKPVRLRTAQDRLMLQVATSVEDSITACRQRVGKVDKGIERIDSLAAMGAALDTTLATLPSLHDRIDREIFSSLDATRRAALVDTCRTNRAILAARILMDRNRTGVGVLESLAAKYKVDTFMFADGAKRAGIDGWAPPPEFRLRTDMARAFDAVRQQIPPAQLAGVVLLTDGGDNGEAGVDSAIRRLGVPVHAILIGGTQQPADASLLAVNAPDSIFLADRVRVLAQVQVSGAAGQTVNVKLLCEGKVVDEVPLVVSGESFQKEVRLSHVPDQKGISHYRVEVSRIPNEYSPDNNARAFDVAVSDDRLNVLLVDSYPRWEFKYLRNLFYGRDKSIELQFVLLNPDELPDQPPRPVIPASASRPAGEAEATALPATPEEWRKFGVIIVGDVGPEAIPEASLKVLRECVAERGALLVVIAGPRNMPHRWSNPVWADMMPLSWTVRTVPWLGSPDPQFRLRLTPEGRQHMLAALSDDATENDEIWTRLPPMSWRSVFDKVKPGAQLIAYADPVLGPTKQAGGAPPELTSRDTESGQGRQALMAIQQYGQGKVVMLGHDQTWRLRYQVGDTYHHRFWGQIVRWGAGERLRAGGEFVRLGTDRLNYAPGETVHVTARLLDHNKSAVKAKDVVASVYEGDKLLSSVSLNERQGSYGIFEGDFPAVVTPGAYRLKLEGSSVAQVLADTKQDAVQTMVTVAPPPTYLEFMRLNADQAFLDRVAAQTGGAVHHPSKVLPDTIQFGAGSDTKTVIVEKVIWDTWLWFVLVVGLVTAEWLLRRKGGLV